MLSALRGVLRAAWTLGLMAGDDYQMAASVESVRGETTPAGRALARGELAALLASCEQTPLGVLYGCGLRREELVTLDLADYGRATAELRVHGKGNKQRAVPAEPVVPALDDWLFVRGTKPGPLFWGLGNRNTGRRLTAQAVYNMLEKRTREAGVEALSPHDSRRNYVGE